MLREDTLRVPMVLLRHHNKLWQQTCFLPYLLALVTSLHGVKLAWCAVANTVYKRNYKGFSIICYGVFFQMYTVMRTVIGTKSKDVTNNQQYMYHQWISACHSRCISYCIDGFDFWRKELSEQKLNCGSSFNVMGQNNTYGTSK